MCSAGSAWSSHLSSLLTAITVIFSSAHGKYKSTDGSDRYQTPRVLKQRSEVGILPHPL